MATVKKKAAVKQKAPSRKKVVAIKFDDLMAHRDGDSESFKYKGQTITCLTAACCSVSSADGPQEFHRGDYLIVSAGGLTPCQHDEFAAKYGKDNL